MNDRELLELAAKAAGKYAPKKDCPNGWEGILPATIGCFMMGGEGRTPDYQWNPLVENGDAFDLAVALHIGFKSHSPDDQWGNANRTVAIFETVECGLQLSEDHNGDPAKATRLAIVKSAAAIQQAKEAQRHVQPANTGS